MPMLKGGKPQLVFKGDHKPIRLYHGSTKIFGWEEVTSTGQAVTLTNTYNDAAHVEVKGNTELQSDYMECWGGSTQDGTPSPSVPVAVTPFVTAGTYKITTDYGIYEVTVPDLHGIAGEVDKVVFDALSGKGYLESACGKLVIDGVNAKFNKNDTSASSYMYYFWVSHAATIGLSSSFTHYDGFSNAYAHVGGFSCSQRSDAVFFNLRGVVSGDNATLTSAVEANAWASQNPVTVLYQLLYKNHTALTFTKVASSTATELPLHAFGRNLLNYNTFATEYNLYGINISRSSDTLSISGTPTTTIEFRICKLTVDAGTYHFNFNPNRTDIINNPYRIYNHTNGAYAFSSNVSSGNIILTSRSVIEFRIRLGTESILSNYTLQLILTTPDQTSYEPFNRTPPDSKTPSFDYPQVITPASGNLSLSYGESINTQQIPALYAIKDSDGAYVCRDKLIIDDATQSAWIERNVGVKVIDGTENHGWLVEFSNSESNLFYFVLFPRQGGTALTQICTHFNVVSDVDPIYTFTSCCGNPNGNVEYFRVRKDTGITTLAEWKAFLAAQYAAGTPVTVAYELATPTTESISYTAAKTYYPTTVVELTSNLPVDVSTTYKQF